MKNLQPDTWAFRRVCSTMTLLYLIFVPEKVSNIGPGILKAGDMDAIIFTLAESYFNQAELSRKALLPPARAQGSV